MTGGHGRPWPPVAPKAAEIRDFAGFASVHFYLLAESGSTTSSQLDGVLEPAGILKLRSLIVWNPWPF